MSNRDKSSKDDKVYTQKQLSYLTIDVLKGIIKSRYITTIDMNVKNNKSDYIDAILQHQEEASRNSSKSTYRIYKYRSIEKYSLPTLLVIKILGYYIHEVGLAKKREILLLSKHLDNLLHPLVMDEVVLDIRSDKYKRFANSNIQPYGIKTDYLSLYTLYNLINEENSKYSKDIFNSLQHITLFDPKITTSVLEDIRSIIFNNIKTITSIDISIDHEHFLSSAPNIKQLSIRSHPFINLFKLLNRSFSISSIRLHNIIQHLSIPTLTTLTLYNFKETNQLNSTTLPNNIVNLHIHFDDYHYSNNDNLIHWVLKQNHYNI